MEKNEIVPLVKKYTQKVVLLFFETFFLISNGIGTISNSACRRSIKEPNHFSLDGAHCKSCTSTVLNFRNFSFTLILREFNSTS